MIKGFPPAGSDSLLIRFGWQAAWPRRALAVVFVLLGLWQASVNLALVNERKPYEGWDEIWTYNNARVLSGPNAGRHFRYGTLESLIQIAATQYFLLFDPGGRGFEHYSYSDNNKRSFTDNFLVFGWIPPEEFGFGYFRGVDDRKPIFLSREFHLIVFYGLAGLVGAIALYYLGVEAALMLLPLLVLTASTELFSEEAGRSLPNAINAVLAFGIGLSSFLALQLRRSSCLLLGAVLLGVAVNFKIDIATMGLALGSAVLIHAWRLGGRDGVRLIVVSAACFLATCGAANPEWWVDPRHVLGLLVPTFNDKTPAEIFQPTITTLQYFLDWNLLGSAPQDSRRGLMALGGVAALLAGTGLILSRRRANLLPLLPPTLAVLALWVTPLVAAHALYPRYLLNGLGALYALIGAGLVMLWRSGGRSTRAVAFAAALLLLTGYGRLMAGDLAHAEAINADSFVIGAGENRDIYDGGSTRNRIEARAIEAWAAGGYDRTILVDQHGYFDLRMLRLAGMRPVYINLYNDEKVLRELDRSVDHLLLLSPGSYATDPSWWEPWMTPWTPETEQLYDAYRARLGAFPVRDEIPGPPQRLLWVGPVARDDHVVLAVIPHRP